MDIGKLLGNIYNVTCRFLTLVHTLGVGVIQGEGAWSILAACLIHFSVVTLLRISMFEIVSYCFVLLYSNIGLLVNI